MTATSAVCTDKSVLQEGQEGQEERNKSPYLLSLLLMLLASGWRPNKAQTRALRAYFGGADWSLTAASIRCRHSATACHAWLSARKGSKRVGSNSMYSWS